MSDLIDREELLVMIDDEIISNNKRLFRDDNFMGLVQARNIIRSRPTVWPTVGYIKPGHWFHDDDCMELYCCSCCYCEVEWYEDCDPKFSYCPWCGAYMKGDIKC